jgi:ArsR family transcriptional regulator
MKDNEFKLESDILSAIAHPNRLRILESLKRGAKCNCELMPELGLEQSNLSRHLKVLVDRGLLRTWRDGVRINYEVTDKKIFALIDDASSIARKLLRKKLSDLRAE